MTQKILEFYKDKIIRKKVRRHPPSKKGWHVGAKSPTKTVHVLGLLRFFENSFKKQIFVLCSI